jgi:hypothetical protein
VLSPVVAHATGEDRHEQRPVKMQQPMAGHR